ncbi:Short-chain dehydrogenase/reductase SDR [Penicillium griseofulvum]|uniref:Short-chain dehydrogenase/reductase SDR n=1 Tax=Penicillium patulum TaxID=5078 RepID=A0A135LI34_PENPA|nr:Short-chain dehydrogenase/reductase SDR [Penicillium griseofulvum]KXG48598.1 Short-chain dehydrogenase/reductase SDR [Penicillium griseofulvum]
MSSIAKTVIATGTSSGLGFEAIKQLLQQAQPYSFILGVRDTEKTRVAYDDLKFDTSKHSVSILPLDLLNLKSVQSFAKQALSELGHRPLNYLFLIAGLAIGADGPGPHGSKWCESYMVNHLAQHYLTHQFVDVLSASQSRIVVVSTGAIRNVRGSDPGTLDVDLKANSGANAKVVYSASKFTQLLGAHYWRRTLPDCKVVAVSPGLIPNTKLAQHSGLRLTMDMPDAKTVPEGAHSILRAVTAEDFPDDPEQIFLTSWGEWWPKDVYALSLDTALQDKWCLSKEDIEKSEPVFQE